MTKYFRKVRNHETLDFLRDFERDMIKDEEGDIFTLTAAERGREEGMEEEPILVEMNA